MGVIIPDPEDMSNSSSALAAEMAAALFDNERHSPAIRKATREWVREQRANGYVSGPRETSWSSWTLILLPLVALLPIA